MYFLAQRDSEQDLLAYYWFHNADLSISRVLALPSEGELSVPISFLGDIKEEIWITNAVLIT